MIEVSPITVKIEFRALDNLVDYLRGSGATNAVKPDLTIVEPAVKPEKPVDIAESVPAPDDTETPVTPTEVTETVEETPAAPVEEEKKYKPDEVAAMAMRLRDKDRANSAKVKEHFPALGIVSLSDIRTNDEACQKLAKILIEMGGAE